MVDDYIPQKYYYSHNLSQLISSLHNTISSFIIPITMEKTFSQVEFNIFLSMLEEYLTEKEDNLQRLDQNYLRLVSSHKHNLNHDELITYSKQVLNQISTYYIETKDFFVDAQMHKAFNFFHICFTITEQTIKCLIQALRDRINRTIDGTSKQPPDLTRAVQVEGQKIAAKSKKQQRPAIASRQQLQKVTQTITKDLQSIDYCLNMLTADDLKSYNDRKFQFEKLMHHRRSIESIKPSQATKQIMQTADLIEGAAENAQKVFQESYLMNYLEFKAYLANIKDSQTLVDDFKKQMEMHTKQKFIDAITKNTDRILHNQKDYWKLHQASVGVQTDEAKKISEKLQQLLIAEKKNNQKLNAQLQIAKKNSSTFGADKGELQKKLEKQISAKKQIESQYLILQKLYNEKCYQLSSLQALQKSLVFKTQPQQKNRRSSIGSQTIAQNINPKATVSQVCQTDVDFYYYFENKEILQLQNKIYELQNLVNHKQYIIKQMEAVRTFRDKFKSKKQIISAVLIPKRSVAEAKSLRYLREEEEASLKAQDHEDLINSIEAVSTKRLVTFRETGQKDQHYEQGKNFHLRKKSQKQRSLTKNRTYYALNDKIVSHHQVDQFIVSKSSYEHPQEVSLKSILKVGYANNYKMSSGTQTDINELKKDTVIENQDTAKDKKNSGKQNKSRLQSKEGSKDIIRPSVTSTIKSSREDRSSGRVQVRRSNFLFTQTSPFLKTQQSAKIPSIEIRKSETIALSSLLTKTNHQSYRPLPKLVRLNELRMTSLNHQALPVNKTINLNFECNLPQSKAKNKYEKENRGLSNRKGVDIRTLKRKK